MRIWHWSAQRARILLKTEDSLPCHQPTLVQSIPIIYIKVILKRSTRKTSTMRRNNKEWKKKEIPHCLVWSGAYSPLLYAFTFWLGPFCFPFPAGIRWLGAGIFITGDLLFVWSHRTLRRNWSPFLAIWKEYTLVTKSSYKLVRYPMHAAIFLIDMGMSLLSANWIVALFYVLPAISLYLLRASN